MAGFLLLVLAVVFLHIVGERRRDLRKIARVWLIAVLMLMVLDRKTNSIQVVEINPFESAEVQALALDLMECRDAGRD